MLHGTKIMRRHQDKHQLEHICRNFASEVLCIAYWSRNASDQSSPVAVDSLRFSLYFMGQQRCGDIRTKYGWGISAAVLHESLRFTFNFPTFHGTRRMRRYQGKVQLEHSSRNSPGKSYALHLGAGRLAATADRLQSLDSEFSSCSMGRSS